MKVKILHNPRCSKSRETLVLLKEKGLDIEIEHYLERTYSIAELKQLAKQLNVTDFRQMMRTKDALFNELQLDLPETTQDQLLQAMHAHSALIERPIVIFGNQAKIGRPPESVLLILPF